MQIRNIVFDLGGVILNIDFKKTEEAFARLGVQGFGQYFSQYNASPLFKQLEKGRIEDSFYDDVRAEFGIDAGNESIRSAWNAMLLDYPPERIERIRELSTSYRLFLFSNTNAIHHQAFCEQFRRQFGFDFDELFEKAWYSHIAGVRKPDAEAFQFMVREGRMEPGETLFLDDTITNVEAARRSGMGAELVSQNEGLLERLRGL